MNRLEKKNAINESEVIATRKSSEKIISFLTKKIPNIIQPFVVGSLLFLYIVGFQIVPFNNIYWLIDCVTHEGITMICDSQQHLLCWLFFRSTDFFQFPLLSNFSYGLENWSATIIHTDSLPIMALLFRPFSSYLPQLFQYFGYWIYLCFLFQGFCSYYLINHFLKDRTKSLISMLFFLIAPIFLWRLWGHYALLAQGLLLLSFYLYFSDYKKYNYWLALLLISSLINAYFSGMILLLFLCNLIKKNTDIKQVAKKFFKVVGLLLLFPPLCGK